MFVNQFLDGLGYVLDSSSVYSAGNTYTVTVQPNTILQKFESTIKDALNKGYTGRFFEVLSVTRTFGSGRFAVTIKAKKEVKYVSGNMFIVQDLVNAGMNSAEIIQVESGQESTKSGGLKQAIPETAGAISKVASRTLKEATMPMLPWLIIAGVGASVVFFVVKPYLEEKAKSYVR